MEITWYGHSCFRLKGKDATVITDPVQPGFGYSFGKVAADIVTVSHHHEGHNYIQGVTGNPYLVQGPGEYEIKEVLITGVDSFHDAEKGKILGHNTIYIIHLDDIAIGHLGDLGAPLSAAQQEEITDVDVLLIPVGGKSTINASQAAEVISQAEPKIIIPMHYATPVTSGKNEGLDSVDKFFREMGIEAAEPQPKLSLTKASLPEQPQIIALSYKS